MIDPELAYLFVPQVGRPIFDQKLRDCPPTLGPNDKPGNNCNATLFSEGFLFDDRDAINRRNFLSYGLTTRLLGRGPTAAESSAAATPAPAPIDPETLPQGLSAAALPDFVGPPAPAAAPGGARARVAAPEQRRGERARRLVLPAARRLPGLHLPLPLRPEHDDPGDDDARPSLPRARLPRAPHLALQLLGAPGGGLRQDEPGRAPLPRPVHALRARLLRADSRPSRLRGLRAARADAAAGRRPGGAGRALQLLTHGPATREPGRQ